MKKYSLLFLLVGTLVMIVVMTKTGATLKTPDTPKGILDLEFAYNTTLANDVKTAWVLNPPANNIGAAKINTWLDFIFLFFYSLFLFFTCKKIARLSNGIFSKAGILFAKGALIAGFLDILENAGMLYTLSGPTSETVALCTAICSVIKWVLALLAVLYCLTGLIYAVSQKKMSSLLA
ncbi:hypothetical protein [Ferruginibacter sp. SUN106]|uniref:hypothetical protein n=1 Tax=Ferruginibacter sp. SUN106 TaxID=2978348 RepID=UPI003D35CEB5